MTEPKKLDDSRLLDLLLEKRDADVGDELDPDSRVRLEELRKIHTSLRALAQEDADAGLSEDAMAAVVRRAETLQPARATPVVALRARRWRPMAAAAAMIIVAAVGWATLGPGSATRAVEAGVFGGLELIRGGETVVTPVAHRLRIRPGDVILSRGGGELDIGGYFLKIGQNARLTCLQLSDHSLVLGLETGRLRCERIQPDEAQLTIHVGDELTLKAQTGSVFAVQWMSRPDDQLEVDSGDVTVRCSSRRDSPDSPERPYRSERVDAGTGPYSLSERCPSAKLPEAKKAVLEPCHHRGRRPEIQPSQPTQTDPAAALQLARESHNLVLVTREDGPDISPCYKSCCFVDFVAKRRGLGGVVWLVLDPKKQARTLAGYNLTDDRNGVVVLNDHGEVMDRGRIESDDGMYAAVLDLIRSGRSKCGR